MALRPQFRYIKNPLQLQHEPLSGEGPLFIDLETYGVNGGSALDTRTNQPRLGIVAAQTGPVFIIDFHNVQIPEFLGLIEGREIVGHNLAFDLPILMRWGFELPNCPRDTMIASQVLLAGMTEHQGHSLKVCVSRYLEKDIEKEHGASDWSNPILSDEQLNYAGEDVEILRELYADLQERLTKFQLTETFDMESKLLPAVIAMTREGVYVDVNQWKLRSIAVAKEAEELKEVVLGKLPASDLKEIVPVRMTKKGTPRVADVKKNAKNEHYNRTNRWKLSSPVQVMEVFKRIGIELPDTQHKTLIERAGENPILDLYIKFRKKNKEANSFGLNWLECVNKETQRFYPHWRQLGTKSGRMSCANPNLQQMPRGACRKGISAAPGKVFVRADFSQIEARVAAFVSGDETLTKLFVENSGDIHIFTASRVLGIDPKQVTKEQRQIGKSLLFGLLFGMQAIKLQVYCRTNYGVKMTLDEAHVFRQRFFEIFPGLQEWHNRQRKVAYKQYDFRTITGRRRFIHPSIQNVNRHGVSLNHPVQGTAADMLKLVVIDLWEKRNEFPDARVVALIHDEIILETPEELADATGRWLKDRMITVGNALIDPIPTDTEIKIGKTWGG